ncbi:uncharacterized protein METZ01_LOCUS267041 [marine metagenome]|uniref:Cytochrome c domain-containing protein n=1 Tax=marine metagenome TaxID=408172 RepID=A0A382JT81_9ZZZZ
MNKAPWIFLGVLFMLSLSWWGMVYGPATQLGGETPDKGDGTALKPRVGFAKRGEQVYRENGCYYCHTRTATGGKFGYELQLTQLGDDRALTAEVIGNDKMSDIINQAFAFKSVAKAADALKAEQGKTEGKSEDAINAAGEAKAAAVAKVKSAKLDLDNNLNALGISGVSLDKELSSECGLPAELDDTQKELVANAKVAITQGTERWLEIESLMRHLNNKAGAQFKLQPVASDWPDVQNNVAGRQSVSRDFLFDVHAMPGVMRIGPDLSNVGSRLMDDNAAYAHIYNPQSTGKSSHMPPYRYLFHRKEIVEGDALPSAAITVTNNGEVQSVEPGYAVTPTAKAKALLAFLRSLRTDSALPEAPLVKQAQSK